MINSEKLTIPHPRIRERNFVLAPLAEIAPELVHPVLNQTMQELWTTSDDQLGVKKYPRPRARIIFATASASITACLSSLSLLFKSELRYEFITIEGNIGAGKTTLATLLSQHYNARLVLEAFADNPFLPQFYENPKQFAFPLELFLWLNAISNYRKCCAKDMFHRLTISDYLFTKSLLFAKVTLTEDEYKLYQRLFDIVQQQLIHPQLLVYLHAPVSRLQQNIKKGKEHTSRRFRMNTCIAYRKLIFNTLNSLIYRYYL